MKEYYYYHKDCSGREVCYGLLENQLTEDKRRTLQELTRDDFYPVELLEHGNYWIYDNPELREKVKDSGLELPVYVVTRLSGEQEIVKTEEEILDELIAEYAGTHAFKIPPTYFEYGEITERQAEKRGMWFLANTIHLENRAAYPFIVKEKDSDIMIDGFLTREEALEFLDDNPDEDWEIMEQ